MPAKGKKTYPLLQAYKKAANLLFVYRSFVKILTVSVFLVNTFFEKQDRTIGQTGGPEMIMLSSGSCSFLMACSAHTAMTAVPAA